MKNYKTSFFLSILLVFVLSACEKEQLEPEVQISFSEVARDYLSEVMNIMEDYSINKYSIDWSEFRSQVLLAANGAETIEDTYPGIEKALALLADNHSVFIKPDGGGFTASGAQCEIENITEASWPDNTGYVKVNGFPVRPMIAKRLVTQD